MEKKARKIYRPKRHQMSPKTEKIVTESLESGTIGPFDTAEEMIKALRLLTKN